MNIRVVFKYLKKNCLAKKNFMVCCKKVSDKDYECALKVWNTFEIKVMKDYHNLYLKYDVLLLAYVFEKFRSNSLKKLWIMPKTLFKSTRFILGCNA